MDISTTAEIMSESHSQSLDLMKFKVGRWPNRLTPKSNGANWKEVQPRHQILCHRSWRSLQGVGSYHYLSTQNPSQQSYHHSWIYILPNTSKKGYEQFQITMGFKIHPGKYPVRPSPADEFSNIRVHYAMILCNLIAFIIAIVC